MDVYFAFTKIFIYIGTLYAIYFLLKFAVDMIASALLSTRTAKDDIALNGRY